MLSEWTHLDKENVSGGSTDRRENTYGASMLKYISNSRSENKNKKYSCNKSVNKGKYSKKHKLY